MYELHCVEYFWHDANEIKSFSLHCDHYYCIYAAVIRGEIQCEKKVIIDVHGE